MSRNVSISRANALGTRLRKADVPSEEDLKLLQDVLADHAMPMATVQAALSTLDLQSTARFKTSGTIIDKLRRDQTRLSKMQDLAGARVVTAEGKGLRDQDGVVNQILQAFPSAPRVDLRRKPRSGYRAVHVVVSCDGCLVEVQVRTEMQDLWANLVESFEGEMGRAIRYGGRPAYPRQRVLGIINAQTKRALTQTQLVKALDELSRLVRSLEEGRAFLDIPGRNDPKVKERLKKTEKEVRSLFKGVLAARRKALE